MTQFPRAAWQGHDGIEALLAALDANEGATRFVGGFVRDTLLGVVTADIDCATRLAPEEVLARVERAGFKAVPTGLAHGTVTAVLPSGPVEITTLRRDVSTDGRRATIAYTDDWREDAARRDFTINALSADPVSGEVHDYFDGLADLTSGRVRFIGDALTRIAEDHLRILRFFRFHARFGQGGPDPEAMSACAARANDLMALSRERIADELIKLLGLADPSAAVALMIQHGIFRPVLPEIDEQSLPRLERLIAAEERSGTPPAALRRLAALLPSDIEKVQSVGARLKLSNAARKRLALAAGPASAADPRPLAYEIGVEAALDRLLIAGDAEAATRIASWHPPRLPISGGAIVAAGIKAGPEVAAMLKQIETKWVAEGFPPESRVQEIASAVIERHRP